MTNKMTFKRHESKYLITLEEKQKILQAMELRMKIDEYGKSTIRSVYFDTDDFRLIRRSIEKPLYKEKLRVRSYKSAGFNDNVFLELKKKFDSIVYKRRITMTLGDVIRSFDNGAQLPDDSQIAKEIDYFRQFYGDIKAKMLISYDREAYYATDGSDFRVTFDENVLFRTYDMTLSGEPYGTKIIDDNQCLMEIKTAGAMPLWMCEILSENKIYKTSFSKYGKAYQMIEKELVSFNKRVKYA